MKRLRIGFDVDGVLADFAGPAMEIGRKMFPDAHIHNGVWDLGMTPEQADAVLANVATQRDFYYGLPLIEGAQYLTEAQRKHTLYFITARNSTIGMPIEEQTHFWLNWMLDIDAPTVIVVPSGKHKAPLYDALHLDAFIEDRVDTIEDMISKGRLCYVFDQPWNQRTTALRVSNVEQYVEDVEDKVGAY
jgi:uncharacterized HAD superfamily protein